LSLNSDAVGLIEVPNGNLLFEGQTFYKFTLEHLINFTEETFAITLMMAGFKILKYGTIRNGSTLSFEVRKQKEYDFEGFKHHEESLYREINDFLTTLGDGQIAIWGAGHYTFGILARPNKLNRSVDYIIDSAPFKQGLFSPKSHIKIISPDDSKKLKISGILVSAAGYSDEVINIIKNDLIIC